MSEHLTRTDKTINTVLEFIKDWMEKEDGSVRQANLCTIVEYLEDVREMHHKDLTNNILDGLTEVAGNKNVSEPIREMAEKAIVAIKGA